MSKMSDEEIVSALRDLPDSILEKFAQTCRHWGDECAGGSGQEIVKSGPLAGHQYGEPYYLAAVAFQTIALPESTT